MERAGPGARERTPSRAAAEPASTTGAAVIADYRPAALAQRRLAAAARNARALTPPGPLAPAKPAAEVPAQRIFTVGSTAYNDKNCETLPEVAEVQAFIKSPGAIPAFQDKIITLANLTKDVGTFEKWADLFQKVTKDVKTDAQQYDAAARQLMTRFSPKDHAYIGLGGSPDIIMRAIMR